ncbi:helix-turn-helix domain-containing protein [Paenibacillus sp. WQ 127069]|uniref:Helix-turn-helix domain-containing protein n=1 Tax=Paenibacillus baimaensis TaxID=2982185 RepID=A0ABT2U8E5_9BACL|nr:helix-turn-helix domain-containing protein [Paenibacillus sp. WQ 127069]MCU6790893.1 helix-turn-helix domain-containing protein [Paenibacillus sp. WQ 127069]
MLNPFHRVVSVAQGVATKYRKNLLHRLVWLSCFSICVPVIITGVAYYQISMTAAEQQAIEQSQSGLTNLKDSMENLLQGLEKDSFQLAVEPLLTESAKIVDLDTNYAYQQQMIDMLTRKANFNSWIHEIVLYRLGDPFYISSESGNIRKERYKMHDDIELVLQSKNLDHWELLPIGVQKGYITFTRQLKSSADNSMIGVLIYQIKLLSLQDYLEVVSGWGSSLYVLDRQTEVLLNSSKSSGNGWMTTDVKQFLNGEDAVNSRYLKQGNRSAYLFTYVKTALGRTYVSVTPREIITNGFTWIGWLTAIVVCFVMICTMLITVLNLRRIYNPIEQLMRYGEELSRGRMNKKAENEFAFIRNCLSYMEEESNKINEYVLRIQPTLREKFLQMVLEWNPFIRHSLESDCKTHGIEMNQSYGVLVADVENMHRESRFVKGDQPVVAFAVANMMDELLASGKYPIRGYVLLNNEGKAAAIISPVKEMAEDKWYSCIREYGAELSQSMATLMKIKVSIGVGGLYSHIADVSISYQEAKIALQRRIYGYHEEVLLFGDTVKSFKPLPQLYPNTVEARIRDCLNAQDVLQAEQELDSFLEKLGHTENPGFIHQSYFMLLSGLLNALQSEGGNLYQILKENVLFEELGERRTVTEIKDWFTERFFSIYVKALRSGSSCKGKQAIAQICKYIRSHVLENPSLVQCSELVSMNPSYISHMFRKEIGMGFIEFITECKLEESKRLLSKTDMTIADIAGVIGFSDRHFLRVFQKHYSLSPSQFRAARR